MTRTPQHRDSESPSRKRPSRVSVTAAARLFRSPRTRFLIGVLASVAVAGLAVPAVAARTPVSTAAATNAGVAANVTAGTSSRTIPAVEATWTSTRYPTSPRTAQPYLSASKSADASFLKFDTSSLQGETVVSASLQLRVASTTATRAGVQVYRTATTWAASSLTQKTIPARIGGLASTASVSAVVGKTISIPLGSDASMWAESRTSLEVRYSQAFTSNTFYRTGTYGPKLLVVLSDGSIVAPAPTPEPSVPVKQPTPPPSVSPGPTQNGDLAFAVAKSNSSARKVFAHYFPPYPVSFDNQPSSSDYYARNYLTATGEGGAHTASGGLLRDRPEARDPLPGDWQLADMISEVNSAADAGIDGFTVDILSLSGNNWDRTVLLMKAAQQSGRNFTIVPNLDATASAGKSDVDTVAAKLAELYAYSSAYKLPTGESVLSSFAAERQTPAWWTQLKNTLSIRFSITTAFVAILLSPSDSNLEAFAPISYAIGNWGTRTAETITAAPGYAAKVHSLGVKWIAPVAIQDERPRSFLYAEANNTETLRASWDRAESDNADLVQLVTWNDYSEGTSFAPSAGHGNSFLDINAFYATRFKTGSTPAVTGDAIYVTNRIQAFAAVPTTAQQLMAPTLSGTAVKPRDAVEVLTFLAQNTAITVTIGNTTTTYTAPVGMSTKTFPIAVGGISVTAARAGAQVAKVISTHPIVAKPLVQDLAYYANNSRER